MSDMVSYMLKSASGQMMNAMASTLQKAAKYAAKMDVDEAVLLSARLYPDMAPLTRQVQIAADTVARGAARLAGLDMPSFPDTETTIDELIARLKAADAFTQGVDSAAMDANATVLLEIPLGPNTVQWEGRQYLSTFILPNLHFHASIAYALLREQGLAIGKRDFLMG